MGSGIIPPGNAPELLCRGRAGTGRSCSIETCGDFVSPIPGFGGIRSFPAKPQDGGAECGIWENTEALPGDGDSSDPGKIQGMPSGALKKRNFGVGEPPALRGPGICDVTIAPTATSLQSFGDGLELFGGIWERGGASRRVWDPPPCCHRRGFWERAVFAEQTAG